jgi:ABC-type phosphate/phosphonate transport system substrate-binding protein
MKHARAAFARRQAVTRRCLLQTLGALAAGGWAAPAAANSPWRLLVNEAVTGDNNAFLLMSRYRPFAEHLAPHAKVKEITVEPVVDIKRFLSLAQEADKPELVFGKSVNQLAKLVRDHGYQPLARRADPYKAAFIVPKDSPIKTLADIGNATVVMPDEFAATTAVARAELRRLNLNQAKVTHVKFQEVVAMEIKMGMGKVGVVNPTVAKKWAEEGGRVLGETQPVVNWSLLASPRLPAATVEKLRDALMAMNAQSQAVLNQLGVKSWALAERKDYLDLLAYTKE